MTAISAIHSVHSVNSLGLLREVKDFVKGVFSQRPPVKDIVPKWDLSVVLTALADKPFEPPNEASLQAWTWKTIFLVAVTSASRVRFL